MVWAHPFVLVAAKSHEWHQVFARQSPVQCHSGLLKFLVEPMRVLRRLFFGCIAVYVVKVICYLIRI